MGAELMLALNLGTRGTLEALDLLEYTNIRAGSTLAEQRAANGSPDPFSVRMWCLGNEMDGPWQLGHRSAEDYGKIASQGAKAMRQMDPNLELVVCGSSNRSMPTFGTWERVVLEHTYDDIDFISGHSYYQERNGDRGSFLASAVDMDAFIEAVIATADSVKAALRSERTINISFDEWNVWYSDRFNESGKITDVNNVAVRAPAARGPVLRDRRGSRREPADLSAEARRPGEGRVPRPARQRDRADHDRAGRPSLAADHLLPVRYHRAPGPGHSAAARRREPELRDAAYGSVPLVDAVATIDDAAASVAVFLVHRASTRRRPRPSISARSGRFASARASHWPTTTQPPPTASNIKIASLRRQTGRRVSRTVC